MAVKRATSDSERERMTDENIATVITMLSPNDPALKPWTKKDCCSFLGMSYNTARLTTLIEEYQNKVAYDIKRRAENRGKKATQQEIISAIGAYLAGDSIESIAKFLYRGTTFVKSILIANSVTLRPLAHDYFNPAPVPEAARREKFELNEIVYSTRYNANAIIKLEGKPDALGATYRVWLLSGENMFAYVRASELASLRHLFDLGIKL